MKIGYSIPSNQGVDDARALIDLGVLAEELGLDSVWASEHLFHSAYIAERLDNRPYYEPLTILTAVAARTQRIRLGTSVLVLPWHDPPRLGKVVATLDHVSRGRVDLGVGVATTEDEFNNLGVDFKSRGKRANEVLGALRALWTEERPEFAGEFYQYSGLKFSPKPFQKPHPPILIGGHSPAAIRRIAAYGDGWHTLRQSPDEVRDTLPAIQAAMQAAGRDPGTLRTSISIGLMPAGDAPTKPPEQRRSLSGADRDVAATMRAYEAAGVDEIVITTSSADPAVHKAALMRISDDIRPKL